MILIAILRRLAPKFNFLINFYRKIKLTQHLNAILTRFILEGFVELFLSSLINLELIAQVDLIYLNTGDMINFLLSIAYFLYIVFLPLIISSVISTKIGFMEAKLEDPPAHIKDVGTYIEQLVLAEKSFDKKWDCLYDSMRQESNFAMKYYYVYVLRRMIFIMIAYYLNSYPGV